MSWVDYITDKQDLVYALTIVGRYITALADKAQYSLILTETDRILPYVEQNMQILQMDALSDQWYRSILFRKGVALYQTKRYREALGGFRRLKQVDPDNANVRKWAFFSWNANYLVFTRLAFYTGALLVLAYVPVVIVLKTDLPTWARMLISFTGAGLLAYNFLINYLYKKYNR